ncbi:RND transporter [Hahella sp. CCB-MM4]|uniref:efflux RND transporter permease subunit n=1 Tax=Hahella sp. (strain CCB-MM4) TaxID=1926491 RepID=UPI000B9C179F|nr:efflux RND transporter permease subunit [Hahella sp. CCB-MM4]OZG72780.1 RND transporter [Hahella sp. CCB-MM4]
MNKAFSSDLKRRPSGIVSWFIYHPVAGSLLLMIVLLSGLTGVMSLNQEVFPPFAPKQIDISFDVRGASPQDVERLVILKVEQALAGLSGIKRILATAEQDQAQITVELTREASQDGMLNMIKSRVDAIDTFPSYAERPVFSAPEPTEAMMIVSLYGDLPILALLEQGQRLEKALSALPGVSYARIQNPPEMQVSIAVMPMSLNEYGLTLNDIATAISRHSLNLSTGVIETQSGRLNLRTTSQAVKPEDFLRIPVKSLPDGRQLTIRDLADVRTEPAMDYSPSRFNGSPALTLDIRRNAGAGLASVSQEVSEFLVGYQQKLGRHLQVEAWMDESREFTSRSNLLIKNGLTGFLLICLIMGVFIHWRVAFWTAAGIPVSIMGAMAILYFSGMDISLNAITLFGFLIALGLIVDDALVIGESIYSETKNYGHNVANVVAGADKVALPSTFGALTTIAAFFPLTLTKGEMGSRMGSLGIVVICCLLASLLESKLILPGHLRHSPRPSRNPMITWLEGLWGRVQSKAGRGLSVVCEEIYFPILRWALNHPWKILLAATGIFSLSIAIIAMGFVRTSILPDIADYEVSGSFRLNANISRPQREQIARRLEDSLSLTGDDIKDQYQLNYEPIQRYLIDINNQTINFNIEIAAVENAPFDAHEVARLWRERLPKLPSIASLAISGGSGGDEQVAIQLSSDDPANLEEAIHRVKQYLAGIDGVIDIRDGTSTRFREVVLAVTPEGKSAGVTQRWLSEQIRASFYGVEAQRIQNDQQEWRVMVGFPDDYQQTLANLREMLIPLPNGSFAPLSTIATIDYSQSSTSLLRINARRSFIVQAGTLPPLTPEEVVEEAERNLLANLSTVFPGVSYSIEGEVKDSSKSVESLLSTTLLALFIIFALMAIPMRSYRYPLVILALAPLGLVGVILGHWVVGIPLSLISIFGLVGLTGVLINNGLLLVDAYRKNIALDMSVTEAIVGACMQRFRPVFLTSVTTCAGVMPLLWESDPEALWLVPIAVSLGGGVMLGTLLTLVTLPAVLVLLESNGESSSLPYNKFH